MIATNTGPITFLFSDIEGSTSRWEADPEAMASALSRHDAIMRRTLESRGARVFKTVGDSFCAAFVTAGDAVAAALEAQRALAAEDFSAVNGLSVRMALHAGTAEERGGDYFGPTVNRVARLLAVGHGGQVLLSSAAADLLSSAMPAQSSLRDLGDHLLRDLLRPEHVYQLTVPDLQGSFPPIRSLDHLTNNLPAQISTFVGRDQVVAEIKASIDQHALVTLTGAGGAGKTRCAIQAGAELLDGSGDGVWLAELAPIADPALVANVISKALHLQEAPNHPVLDTLVTYLKRKRLLLILDNCEHVIDEARKVAGAILRHCPQVRILATSRQPLNISGETTYRMPSLTLPANAQTVFAEGTSAYGAVQLFVDRAVKSNNRFAFTPENAPHVAEICRRLDGIPLAIELAAARVQVLSPKQLAQKLDERFRILTGGDRSAMPRHQTMRALIDWSYDLLSDAERALFRKLSIFAGGFTLDAVATAFGGDEFEVLDLVSSLVDKSLVQAEEAEGRARYRLLESTRQYSRERLIEAGEHVHVARAHARAFLNLAKQLEDSWETTQDRVWFAQVEPELENFRAALTWAFDSQGDSLVGQCLTGALRRAWVYLAAAEGLRWVREAQDRIDPSTPVATLEVLDLAEANVAAALTQYKLSRIAAERALERYRQVADPRETADAQLRVGYALLGEGKISEGEALLHEALARFRALEARKSVSAALGMLGSAHQFAGDVAESRRLFNEALNIARAAGAERQSVVIALNLSEAEFRAGNSEAALQLSREALIVARAFRTIRVIALEQCNQAAYLSVLGRFDEARLASREALAYMRDMQWSVGIAFTLQHLAAIGALRGGADFEISEDRRRAARVLGYVDAKLAAFGPVREYTEQQEYDAVTLALGDSLGKDEFSRLLSEGSAWGEEQAVAEAMLV